MAYTQSEDRDKNAYAFEEDVLDGLCQPRKSLPSRWLYDARGSELFEEITRLPEYYPTRTETAILREHAESVASEVGPDTAVVEYGAGASVKTRILLNALDDPNFYVPIDISGPFLVDAAQKIQRDYPDLQVLPRVADFLRPLALPDQIQTVPRLGFFPGSTIGNLNDLEILNFLTQCRVSLGADAKFLLGYDLRKSQDILIPAYDDAQGVTAAFNLNILTRINRELSANFQIEQFRHMAIWNEEYSRIEMHLESLVDQVVDIGQCTICFERGETIHTENSRKFSPTDMERMCAAAGWTTTHLFSDPDGLFAVALLVIDD
ncbi:L-histidine N(alpha)-methyltransferase [Hyphomonas sp.]|uniref:L-histidine N(alpha)-methyltransferase n=1 Tax=Hyphomonas sp. TaxID=87 RepID=UPI003564B7BF